MKIIHGDCLEKLKELPENSVDSIVTDPPYGLSFMGKKWDYDVPNIEIWQECLRVLKPGGHLLAFAGTRTQHRMAVRIEDAGFEIRDMIAWVYGSGFPKSHNIGKAVDKLQGNEREVIGKIAQPGSTNNRIAMGNGWQDAPDLTKGTSPYEGWGTALKPALEPITVARKPLIGTVAENVLAHGTGGINIDGSRVGTESITQYKVDAKAWHGNNFGAKEQQQTGETTQTTGRWPANLIHDGSEEVLALFPDSDGAGPSLPRVKVTGYGDGIGSGESAYLGGERIPFNAGSGSAARFFYCPKANRKDRNEGCEGLPQRVVSTWGGDEDDLSEGKKSTFPKGNHHPTVKPTDLMRYLVKLVTPPGGTVLDPFTGSGSTGKACKLEGFEFIGIEREEEYVKIAEARIAAVTHQPTLV